MEKLEQILVDFCNKLPHLAEESEYFPKVLFNHLYDYVNAVELTTDLIGIEYNNDDVLDQEDVFKKDLRRITDGISQSIKDYLNGSPTKAYIQFSSIVQSTYLKTALKTSQIITLPRNNNFYRIRKDTIVPPIDPKELFHIPFDKRKLVAAQRFSIPGYPCLYAGNSILVSCKEVGVFTESDLDSVKAARIVNNSNLIIADIDPYNLYSNKEHGAFGNDAKYKVSLYRSALLYPIIACCHFKVKYANEKVNFKIEYIVPQLLLQWMKDASDFRLINGIRYLSNHIDSHDDKTKMYNYVFPAVATDKEKGHCNQLMNLFSITEVIDFATYPFTSTMFSDKLVELEQFLQSQTLTVLK